MDKIEWGAGTAGPWSASAWIVYAGDFRVATAAAPGLKGEANARAIAEVPAMVVALRDTLEFAEVERRWAETPDLGKWIAVCDRLSAILARIDA